MANEILKPIGDVHVGEKVKTLYGDASVISRDDFFANLPFNMP